MATRFAQAERQALADLLAQLGPDAPTLCTGWKTRDLAAHLVVREHRPDAGLGIVVRALAGYTAKVQAQVAGRPWMALLDTLRAGPPPPLRLVDEQVNTVEFFVHHEDVRRAVGEVRPRLLDPEMDEALWQRCKVLARLTSRRVPVGLRLEWPGHGTVTARRGEPVVTVSGPPAELVLFAFGRTGAAKVEPAGDPAALDRLRRSPLGI